MGDSYRKMKRENEVLVSENAHLKNWVGILTKNIQLLEKEIDAAKNGESREKCIPLGNRRIIIYQSNIKDDSRGSHQFFSEGDDEATEAFNTKKLFFASKKKKGVVEPSTNFSSRFMPNVKFHIMGKFSSLVKDIVPENHWNYLATDGYGDIVFRCDYQHTYDHKWKQKEVSAYEAIPELVPKGMYYDKKSDSLIKKTCSNQMCQGEFCGCDEESGSLKHHIDPEKEKLAREMCEEDCLCRHPRTKFMEERRKVLFKFAESLNHATGFTFEECLDVIKDYGGQNARAVLDLMASGIDPSAFKLEK